MCEDVPKFGLEPLFIGSAEREISVFQIIAALGMFLLGVMIGKDPVDSYGGLVVGALVMGAVYFMYEKAEMSPIWISLSLLLLIGGCMFGAT